MLRMTITTALVLFLGVTMTACSPHQQPIQQPEAPVSKWEALSPTQWTASAQNVTVTVHRVIVAPRHITILYSVAFPTSMVGPDRPFAATLAPQTHLASKAHQMRMLRAIPIRSFANVNLGVAVFEPYPNDGETLILDIPEIELKKSGVSPITVTSAWGIPLLRDQAPNVASSSIYNVPGLPENQVGSITIKNLGGAFTGDSPRGQVVTFAVGVGDTDIYMLVTETGDVEALNAEEYKNILVYLGIQTPNASTPPTLDREITPVGEATPPTP